MPSRRKVKATGKAKLLAGVDSVPWGQLQHAYGAAKDVPGLLRKLLVADPKLRRATMDALYGNVFHQGTRFPATPYVVPFLIELCASPAVPDRGELLRYWGSLITGYFSVPGAADVGRRRAHLHVRRGRRHNPTLDPDSDEDDVSLREALHGAYRESLAGRELLVALLDSDDVSVRMGAAWVLACLQTRAAASPLPALQARAGAEPSGWARAALALRSVSWARRCRCIACSPATTSRPCAAWQPASSRASIPAMACWSRCWLSWPSRSTATRTSPAPAASPPVTRRFDLEPACRRCSAGP